MTEAVGIQMLYLTSAYTSVLTTQFPNMCMVVADSGHKSRDEKLDFDTDAILGCFSFNACVVWTLTLNVIALFMLCL